MPNYSGAYSSGRAPLDAFSLRYARELPAASKAIAPYTSGDLVDRVDNGTSAGTSTSGLAWTAVAGTLQVATNALGGTASANQRGDLSVGHSDGRYGCRIKTVSGQCYLTFRSVDATNFWRLGDLGAGAGVYILQKIVSGSTTTLLTTSAAVASGDRLVVTCSGNSITVSVNGAAAGTVSDSALSTATRYGFQTNNATARFDQFFSATV